MLVMNTENNQDVIGELLRLTRNRKEAQSITADVRTIIENVWLRGDEAVIAYAKKFDHVDITPDDFYLDMVDVNENDLPLTDQEKSAIRTAAERLSAFALSIRPKDSPRTDPDNFVAQKFVPYDRVACYVPSGSFPLVSTVLHTCAFVKAAGVPDCTIITPCKKEGIHPAILYAAKIIGVNRILKLGGVYGIAAVAYGTKTVKPVEFIAGPGNAYVTEAKKQVFGQVNIDMLAGPSEVMVIADETANPEFVAADLLSQAEHGSGFEQAVLVTTSQNLVDTIGSVIARQREKLPDSEATDRVLREGLYMIKAGSLDECADICNAYAPEHVEIITRDPDALEPKIKAAGAIMLGAWTPEPIGDFVAGSSHVLPTGGAARMFSGLSTTHFLRKVSVQKFDREELSRLRLAAETFAAMECLAAHGRAVSIRFD